MGNSGRSIIGKTDSIIGSGLLTRKSHNTTVSTVLQNLGGTTRPGWLMLLLTEGADFISRHMLKTYNYM